MKNEKFDELAREAFETVVKENPILATGLGMHEYDHLMPDGSLKKQLEHIELMKRYLQKFEKLDPQELSNDRRLDREVALHILELSLFNMETLRFWESIPLVPNIVGAALFLLFAREFAPFEQRIKSIIRRLENIPKFIEDSKSKIINPIELWTEMAIEGCDHLPLFLQLILEFSKSKIDEVDMKRLEKAVHETKEQIEGYKEWLINDVLPRCKKNYAIGEEKFKELIELRELGLSVEEILSLGEEYLESEKRKLKNLAMKIEPGAAVENVKDSIRSKHPKNFELALDLYKRSIIESKEFVKEHDIATIPSNERLVVRETPQYLTHTVPFAAYFSPAKFDEEQFGIYIVTPTENEAMLREHNYASITNTSVHEGYPGHHLQLTCANKNPSLIRTLCRAIETIEGWAHYCEEFMKDMGYDDTLESRFVQTLDSIWRATRIIIDVKLSCGKMSFNEAVDFLIEQTGMEKKAAIAEVKRYTQNPAYQLSYLLGKHLIKDLKMRVKKRMGSSFSDKFFHDTILNAGSLPMKYIEEIFDEKLKHLER